MKTLILILAATLQMGMAAEPMVADVQLQKMAREAVTSADHAKVAKQYRLRAESFESKAAQHETNAEEAKKYPLPAMAHKWPSMVRRPETKHVEMALQARRAAREAREMAAKHTQLAVEAAADK